MSNSNSARRRQKRTPRSTEPKRTVDSGKDDVMLTPVAGETPRQSGTTFTSRDVATERGATDRAAERRQRRQDALAADKRKRQRNLLFGALGAALLVALLLAYFNRPTNDGGKIDYSGLATQSAPIIAAKGTPGPTPTTTYAGTSIGDPNAPVTMAVYSDMQCPYCRQFHETILPNIIQDFVKTGKVRIEFREFPVLGYDGNSPLGIESDKNESSQAAQAAMCAGEQGKYLQYQDKLFANQAGENKGAYNNDRLKKFASELDLNTGDFTTCLASGKYEPALKASLDQGKALGVNATPMFVLYNGNGNPKVTSMSSEGYTLLKSEIQTAIDTAKK